mgnify:CR=1 FL=1
MICEYYQIHPCFINSGWLTSNGKNEGWPDDCCFYAPKGTIQPQKTARNQDKESAPSYYLVIQGTLCHKVVVSLGWGGEKWRCLCPASLTPAAPPLARRGAALAGAGHSSPLARLRGGGHAVSRALNFPMRPARLPTCR